MLFRSKKILERVRPESIDVILFSSLTLDYHAPSTASILHERLQLKTNCAAIDLPLGCTGFTTALMVAHGIFRDSSIQRVLVVLGEVPRHAIHPDDSSLLCLFGDAGSAILLENSDQNIPFVFGNDGKGFNALHVLEGGARNPMNQNSFSSELSYPFLNHFGRIFMDGQEILKLTLQHVPNAVFDLLDKAKLSIEEIDHFIFHQASNIILETLQRKLQIPEYKMIKHMANGGNTVSCTIPIAYEMGAKAYEFKDGANILLFGFGVGFSWCGCVIKHNSTHYDYI